MKLPFKGYLRHKDVFEAADAGVILWRKNFAYFIIYFAIPFWIFAFAFRMLPGKLAYLSWIFMWYLKPLFDRLILHVVSIKFFEPEAELKRLFKGLGRNLRCGLAGDLLWRRFTPFRSATMPIRVLEFQAKELNKKSKIYSERKKILTKGGLGYSFFLTFWGLAMETVLLAGEIIFISMMARFIGFDFDFSSIGFLVDMEIYFFALWCLNYILIETLYVCMGFGVYINSRIEVEGWDIEIIFKNFASKVSIAQKLKNKKMPEVLLLFCLLFIFSPDTATAEPSIKESEYINAGDIPLEALETILASPDFGYEKDIWRIERKNPGTPKERITIINYNRKKFLENLAYFFASGLRTILVIAAVIAAIIIFIFARRYFKNKKSIIKEKPFTAIIQDIPAKNPQELLDKAENYFNNGDLRNAWGYCTAAAIISLQLYRDLEFAPDATETECANIADDRLETEEAKKFRSLINSWVRYVYAGQLPSDGSFKEAVTYCNSLLKNGGEAKNE